MTRFIWSLVLVLTLVLALILGIAALAHHFIAKYEGRQVNATILNNLDSLDQILLYQGNREDSAFLYSLRSDVLSIEEKNYYRRAVTFNRALSKYIDKTFEPVWIHILERQGQSALEDLKISTRLIEIYNSLSVRDSGKPRDEIACGAEGYHDWQSVTKIEQAEDCYFHLRSLKRDLDFANFNQVMDLARNKKI